jgi:pyruvate-formate lyase-activating enzyme
MTPLSQHSYWRVIFLFIFLATVMTQTNPSLFAIQKSPGLEGFAIDLKATEEDVIRAVQAVAEDQVIHGTSVYAREDNLTEAESATSSAYYGAWQGPGRVFFKVRLRALSPKHFKNSNDMGTITIRYVVQAVSANRTHLQIDAVFVEDAMHKVHPSDTTVETSEFAEINSHLLQIHKEEQQTAELVKQREKDDEARAAAKVRDQELARLNSAEASLKDLQARAHQLRHDVEVRVKNPNTELKAAPFQRSAKLQSLTEGTEVVIEIITPYWYGVETDQGQRGWLRQDQVEPLP